MSQKNFLLFDRAAIVLKRVKILLFFLEVSKKFADPHVDTISLKSFLSWINIFCPFIQFYDRKLCNLLRIDGPKTCRKLHLFFFKNKIQFIYGSLNLYVSLAQTHAHINIYLYTCVFHMCVYIQNVFLNFLKFSSYNLL